MAYQEITKKLQDMILDDMGFADASDAQREQVYKILEERMSIAAIKAISDTINQEEAESLASKAESGQNIEKDLDGLFEKYPELSEKVETELGNLYQKMLEEAKQAWVQAE